MPGRARSDRISSAPTSLGHHLTDLLLRTQKRQVDRITEQPVTITGASDEVVRDVERGEYLVDPRQREIGENQPENQQIRNVCRMGVETRSQNHPGQPEHRRSCGNGESQVDAFEDAPAADPRACSTGGVTDVGRAVTSRAGCELDAALFGHIDKCATWG